MSNIELGVPVTFTTKQVAQILNVSRSQVYVLLKFGELDSVRIRGSRRITESQLVNFLHRLEDRAQDCSEWAHSGTGRSVIANPRHVT